jgi:GntR family transcriptional regulator, rspAB operon transcriptional repressor
MKSALKDKPASLGRTSRFLAVRSRSPRQSLRDAAYETIKHRIITCKFKPGERINELQLSAMLGIGRTPVHQALGRLMLEEMVDVIPRKGVIIKPIILGDVLQMVDVRLVNEEYCARLAAERADGVDIERLDAIVGKARKAISDRNIQAMMSLDRDFHLTLGGAAKNNELAELVRKLNERSLRFWYISFNTPDHHNRFQKQHEAILNAVRRHDANRAALAMRAHMEAFRDSVIRQL